MARSRLHEDIFLIDDTYWNNTVKKQLQQIADDKGQDRFWLICKSYDPSSSGEGGGDRDLAIFKVRFLSKNESGGWKEEVIKYALINSKWEEIKTGYAHLNIASIDDIKADLEKQEHLLDEVRSKFHYMPQYQKVPYQYQEAPQMKPSELLEKTKIKQDTYLGPTHYFASTKEMSAADRLRMNKTLRDYYDFLSELYSKLPDDWQKYADLTQEITETVRDANDILLDEKEKQQIEKQNAMIKMHEAIIEAKDKIHEGENLKSAIESLLPAFQEVIEKSYPKSSRFFIPQTVKAIQHAYETYNKNHLTEPLSSLNFQRKK